MNYGALNHQANQFAHTLRGIGAGKDKIIALVLERSPEMIAAMLGVAKAGAAFLPLDVDAPLARLEGILEDSKALALLIQERNRPRLGALRTQAISIDCLTEVSSIAVDQPAIAPSDLAYVLFTSGSTGRPKGVMVEHATLAMRLDWLAKTWGSIPQIAPGRLRNSPLTRR